MDLYAQTNDAIMRQIGSKIKELRIEKNMKQAELADASGVSVFTISSVENGKTTSLLTIVQLLRALEHLDYLDRFFQEVTNNSNLSVYLGSLPFLVKGETSIG